VAPGKREVPEASAAVVSKRCRSGGGGGGSERSPRKPAQADAPACAKLASGSRHLNIREKDPLVPGHARYALKRGLAATGRDSGGDGGGGAAWKRVSGARSPGGAFPAAATCLQPRARSRAPTAAGAYSHACCLRQRSAGTAHGKRRRRR
jgi:hypothetical protein